MPPETAVAPTQSDPKQAAGNIAQGIKDRANGKVTGNRAVSKGPEVPDDADAKKPAAQADPNTGKSKYVVNGKEYWLTPQQAAAYVQKGIAFEPRQSEYARMQQEMQQFENALLANPGAIIANIAKRKNVPVSQLVQNVLSSNASDEVKEATGRWYWENVAMRQRMDPKDRAILERDEKIAQFEKTQSAEKEKAVAVENQRRVNAFLGQTSAFIAESMKKAGFTNSDSPHAASFAKIAGGLYISAQKMNKAITPEMAVNAANQILSSYLDSRDESVDDETFIKMLGDKRIKRVQSWLLKQAKQSEKTQQETTQQRPAPRRNERETINLDQFHDYLDDLKQKSK